MTPPWKRRKAGIHRPQDDFDSQPRNLESPAYRKLWDNVKPDFVS